MSRAPRDPAYELVVRFAEGTGDAALAAAAVALGRAAGGAALLGAPAVGDRGIRAVLDLGAGDLAVDQTVPCRLRTLRTDDGVGWVELTIDPAGAGIDTRRRDWRRDALDHRLAEVALAGLAGRGPLGARIGIDVRSDASAAATPGVGVGVIGPDGAGGLRAHLPAFRSRAGDLREAVARLGAEAAVQREYIWPTDGRITVWVTELVETIDDEEPTWRDPTPGLFDVYGPRTLDAVRALVDESYTRREAWVQDPAVLDEPVWSVIRARVADVLPLLTADLAAWDATALAAARVDFRARAAAGR